MKTVAKTKARGKANGKTKGKAKEKAKGKAKANEKAKGNAKQKAKREAKVKVEGKAKGNTRKRPGKRKQTTGTQPKRRRTGTKTKPKKKRTQRSKTELSTLAQRWVDIACTANTKPNKHQTLLCFCECSSHARQMQGQTNIQHFCPMFEVAEALRCTGCLLVCAHQASGAM